MGWKYLCLEAELPTSITGRDQVAHVRNPRRSYGSGRVAQLNSSDGHNVSHNQKPLARFAND